MKIVNATAYATEDLDVMVRAVADTTVVFLEKTLEARLAQAPITRHEDIMRRHYLPRLPEVLRVDYYKPRAGDKGNEGPCDEELLPLANMVGFWSKRPRLGIAQPDRLPIPPLVMLAQHSSDDLDTRLVPEQARNEIIRAIASMFSYNVISDDAVVALAESTTLRYHLTVSQTQLDEARQERLRARAEALYERLAYLDDDLERCQEKLDKIHDRRNDVLAKLARIEEKQHA